MKELLWQGIAWVVSREPIANYLIKRAQRTPYFDLPGYMKRWWVFNPYGNDIETPDAPRHDAKYPWLPSIRIHHILRADEARDPHDHPWDARTIILKGWYDEERIVQELHDVEIDHFPEYFFVHDAWRYKGNTAPLKYREFHNITRVSDGGVWTLFITWKYQGVWGFLVNGRKVPWREYVGAETV
jgi:hypothetical protein